MIVVGAANVMVGLGSATSHASEDEGTELQVDVIAQGSDGPSSIASMSSDSDDPLHDRAQDTDAKHQHQSHQCHFGHCQFVSPTVSSSLTRPHLVRVSYCAQNVFYLGVDLSTPSRPPSA